MMTEDTLLLYFYDELPADERAEVEAAMSRDPALAAHYKALCLQLSDWRSGPLATAPDAQKQRWHDSIDRMARKNADPQAARSARSRSWFFGIAAAMTAALVAGIFIGTNLVEESTLLIIPDVTVAGPDAPSPAVVPASFTRGLQAHLRDSRIEISRLTLEDDADRTLLTMQLIQQNRVFERAAMQSNAPNLARVLRAFEPILLQLASDDTAPQDMEALRKQLAFELKVMLTKLEAAPSEEAHTT